MVALIENASAKATFKLTSRVLAPLGVTLDLRYTGRDYFFFAGSVRVCSIARATQTAIASSSSTIDGGSTR